MKKNIKNIFFRAKKEMGIGIVLLLLFTTFLTLKNLNTNHVYNSNAYSKYISSTVAQTKLRHPLHILKTINANQLIMKNNLSTFTAQFSGYTPNDIRKAYNLPSTGGNGTIAIIDFFDTPTAEHDLNVFSTQFNLPSCTSANGCFKVVFPSGKPPTGNITAQLETDMDIEWAHAIAPKANILLVESLSDQFSDVLAAIDFTRNQPNISSVSMSFGTDEVAQEINLEQFFISVSGATFFAASGDQGHKSNWPAASQNVISVGGTSLNSNGASFTETAWSGSSGGISAFISEPNFQTTYNIPNTQGQRAIPDVAADADPNTGCVVFGSDGNWWILGGTSLSTPIWAAISSLGNTPVTGNILYQNATKNYSGFYRDITSGSNGTCSIYCTAGVNYDYVTGLGAPITLPLSSGTSPTPTSTPTVTPTKTPTPTLTPTPTVTHIPTPTLSPTSGFSPTPTINPHSTNLSIILGLHGIAKGGDNTNPNSVGNTNPNHQTRNVQIVLTNANSSKQSTFQGQVFYDNPSGFFKGVVNLGNLSTGDYQVKIKTDGFLIRLLQNIVHITSLQITNLPVTYLVNGDINNDNQLNILDYAILVGCFGTKQNTSSCINPPTKLSAGADLDDNGIVDGVDYNLFLREISVQPGD